MSNNSNATSAVVGVLKAIFVSGLKLCALVLAFAFNLLSIILGKLASLFQNLAGYGQGH